MSRQAPPCYHCVLYRDAGRCGAFPDGIPEAVLAGEVDHRQPVDGDNGLRFEPTPEFAPNAAAYFEAWVFGLSTEVGDGGI